MWSLLLILTWLVRRACSDQMEYDLIQHLLHNYDPLERPVADFADSVNVSMKVILQQIVGLDEKNQVIETNVWLQYDWTDYKLRWDPDEYNNVTDVRFPMGKIWKPDILLYNSADSNFDSTYPTNLIVYSTGDVTWVPPGILKSSCKVDITWFPFDDQNCYLKFGSWTYHGLAMNLQIHLPDNSTYSNAMDTSEYIENGEFLLLGTPARRHQKFFTCCPEPYPFLKFFMLIRRRTLYYGLNLIIPSLLISLMTVLGFTLPPDAGEKITLEITILLSVCFFLSMLSDMTPPTSEAVPLIGTFFSCCMLVVSASVVFTVVVLNLHSRSPETHEMSHFVQSVLLNWLPWLLLMRRPGHRFNLRRMQREQQTQQLQRSGTESESLMRNVRSLEVDTLQQQQQQELGLFNKEPLVDVPPSMMPSALDVNVTDKLHLLIDSGASDEASLNAMLLMMQKIVCEMRYITRRMESTDEEEEQLADWRFAAMVVDRLCLLVFSAFIVASTCGIMFSAPHLVA